MTFNELRDVNSEFNLLPYETELVDDWRPIVDAGDCDSYATAKMQRLVDMGWPVSALRLALCTIKSIPPPSNGHLVLLADFDGQTYVLDNRYPFPMKHESMEDYNWLQIQIAGTQNWEIA